jgi:hypothetical protein
MVGLGCALPAAADTISVLRENTLTLSQADGKVTTILIKDGQDLEQVNASGVWAAGFWQIDASRGFCWTARGEATLCIKMPMDVGVGAGWDVAGPTGKIAWKAEIVAGRADLKALSGSAGHDGH